MNKVLLVILILTAPLITSAQLIRGKVVNPLGAPLQSATVLWMSSQKATVTNDRGEFSIEFPKNRPYILLVSYTGFVTDTLTVIDTSFLHITMKEMKESNNLENVTIQANTKSFYIANSPIKTEVITSLELKKAACCDLAGCFETQSTVQPQTTNIVTNSKELRILGLSGIYNQVLIDGLPQVQGLTYTYGISSIPGPQVENIWVAKGANSVLQGYESISGQINVLTKEPDKADKLLLNGFINSFGEKHLNLLYAVKKNKWSNLTTFHMVQPSARVDKDEDAFLDLPLITRYLIANRWKKGDESISGWSSQFAVRYLAEKRIGGQSHFDFNRDKGTTNAYGQAVTINQPEAWFKTAYRVNDAHRFALNLSGFHQSQQSYFGVTGYNAQQTNGYLNLQHEFVYNDNSVLKSGVSYRHLNLSEDISFSNNLLNRSYAGPYSRIENIPGIFAENTLNLLSEKLTWITGIRADRHNKFGWKVTPRTLVRYQVTQNFDIRGSVGKGWRTVNFFSENIGLMASSRDIIFAETLQPEQAINFGFNATHKLKSKNLEGAISIDFYRTNFQNQIFPDFDTDPTIAIIKNFIGKSVSSGFQAEVSGTFFKRATARLGYVYLDVFQLRNNQKNVLPFNPNNRIHSAFSFMPIHKKWHIDMNMHWYGKQRLPDTKNNPVAFQMADYSNSYSIVNMQFTCTIKKFEVYIGSENLFNFRQFKPIISWQDPFGKYFDTQFAWGPTRGREAYLGFRYTLN